MFRQVFIGGVDFGSHLGTLEFPLLYVHRVALLVCSKLWSTSVRYASVLLSNNNLCPRCLRFRDSDERVQSQERCANPWCGSISRLAMSALHRLRGDSLQHHI